MSERRIQTHLLREPPPVRDLLMRATWADLERIAGRYHLQLGGRRRELTVERLAALLERPEQVQAAYAVLPPGAQICLGLLMLLAVLDDERALSEIRDRLRIVRPDLEAALARVQPANDVPILASLGLVFLDRRRLVVPAEVVRSLANPLAPAASGNPLNVEPRSYAAVRYMLEQFTNALGEINAPALQPPRAGIDHPTPYRPLLLPPDVAAALGDRTQLAPVDATLLLSILEEQGSIAALRGCWQLQAGWETLRLEAPRTILMDLIAAWLRPRAYSDVLGTESYGWLSAPDVDAAATIGAIETMIRQIVWRWLHWSGPETIDVAGFGRTLAALHPALFPCDDAGDVWIVPQGVPRQPDEVAERAAIAVALVRRLFEQLALLGLLVTDGASCQRSFLYEWLINNAPVTDASKIHTSGARLIELHPLLAPPDLLAMITTAGRMSQPTGEYSRYEVSAAGMTRLLAQGHTIPEFEAALLAMGLSLDSPIRVQLASWSARLGRLRFHHPLTVLVTDEDAPLATILRAAGVAEASEIIGPGCALIQPEHAEAAIEQLRQRGFWPRRIVEG